MKNLKIFATLFLSHATMALIVILALSVTFYILLSNALIQRTLDQLSSINILKKESIENYLFQSQQNLEALQVENKFLRIYNDLSIPSKNKTADSSNDLLDIEKLCKFYGFKNLHIFNAHHQQLFSTDKEMYPEGLLKEIDSSIAAKPTRLHVVDASDYDRASTLLFYYVPILTNEEVVGIVLVQEDFQKIQNILFETTGMGNTGESYIVGNDHRMRSSSRFFPDSIPESISVETEAIKNSISNKTGRGLLNDYRNVKVLSSYRVINHADLRWTIISEMDETEAMQPIYRFRNYFVLIILFIVAATFVITYWLSNVIAQPILKLKTIILTLSKGIIPIGQPLTTRADEIGQMADAIYQLTEGFKRTSVFANEIGSGNFKAEFTTLSKDDVLGLALIRMKNELQRFHLNELKSARSRAAALMEGQEKERRRIIGELHDGVGQMLTAIRMQVEMLDGDQKQKDEIKAQINETISEVKRISYNVMPQAIVDYGLEAALKGLCDSVKKYSPLMIDFRFIKEIEHTLSFDVSIAVFRIAQEGLNNIVKHANATQVNLHILDKEDEIYLILEDNGKGFNEKDINHHSGSGLRNIRERATLLGGIADIQSTTGNGTSIEIHIPIHDQ